MKKKPLPILISLCFICVILLIWHYSGIFIKDTLYVAVVGNSDAKGTEAVRTVRLYLDKIKSQGGIDGKKIEPVFYNDQNDPQKAVETASEIAKSNNILFVIGHLSAPTSIAAGKIYRRNGIPAITATAIAENITQNNKWYFRIIPDSSIQTQFMAAYLSRIMKKKAVRIIRSSSQFGNSIAQGLKNASPKYGIRIREIKVDIENQNSDAEIKRIITKLKAADEQEMIVLATPIDKTVTIVVAIKEGEINRPILISHSFSSNTFMDKLAAHPRKQFNPEVYSDGIYCLTPYLNAMANKQAQQFENEYAAKWRMKPSWSGAYHYDAIHVVTEALKKTDPKGIGFIREDRRKIREAFTDFFSPESGIPGVTGINYFDSNGNAVKPYVMGIYQNRVLLPAYVQYTQVVDSKSIDDSVQKAINGELLIINGNLMASTQVVYTGMQIHKVSNLDIKNAVVNVEFDLWFRTEKEVNASDITFRNSVQPINLNYLFPKMIPDKDITTVFHVKSAFNIFPNYQKYPFDHLIIPVRFQHERLTSDKLIFVHDLSKNSYDEPLPAIVPKCVVNCWEIENVAYFRDTLSKQSHLGNPHFLKMSKNISYDQFNAEIYVSRKDPHLSTKIFFPFLFLFVSLYVVYFLPNQSLGIRILICMAVAAFNVILNLRLLKNFPIGNVPSIEYIHFVIYLLVFLSVLWSIVSYQGHGESGAETDFARWTYAVRYVYPFIVLLFAFTFYAKMFT